MKMTSPRPHISILGAAIWLAAGTVHAELSANIGITSNYIWRGVSQTQDDAAVQGGIDYSHASGFYAGTWASNVDFGTSETVDVIGPGGTVIGSAEVSREDEQYELDAYFGYAGSAGRFGYDVGIIHYMYPETDGDSDFTELALSASFSALTVGAHYIFSSEVDDGLFAEKDLYTYASLGFDLPQSWAVSLTVGHYAFDVDGRTIDGEKLDVDYTHYRADLTKSAGDYGDFMLSVSKAQEESGDDETKFVMSWMKSF